MQWNFHISPDISCYLPYNLWLHELFIIQSAILWILLLYLQLQRNINFRIIFLINNWSIHLHIKIVLFHLMQQSLNLIYIYKPVNTWFLMFYQFLRQKILNSLHSNNSFIYFIEMSMYICIHTLSFNWDKIHRP